MEILKYTDAHRNFRKRLRDFLAKEVTPHVDQWEKDGIVPKNAWKKMGQAGFLCTEMAVWQGIFCILLLVQRKSLEPVKMV
jgi:alkylation response protein AidB-like acyl-CoA dehydrogenase